jgi:hypothetical protein
MLKRRGITNTLHLGALIDKQGDHKGHAWVEYGEEAIIGQQGYEEYQIIASYT